MDNVTHSLIGALVAEVVRTPLRRGARGEHPSLRGLALFVSILSNNLPDFDFAYRSVTAGKLGYLLHHRGHTHTVPGALALGALALALAAVWAMVRRVRFARREWGAVATLAFIGPFIHIALDYGNNYGVHPFWPFDDAWFYGDTVFIVEPLLWAVSVPALVMSSSTRAVRASLAALFVVGLGIGAARALSAAQVGVIVGVALLVTLMCSRIVPERRALVALAGWAFVTALFAFEGREARARVLAVSRTHFPTSRVVDIVTTPRPADPFCWSVLVLAVDGSDYVARRGAVSVAPWARRCETLDGATSTAPLRGIAVRDGGVYLDRELVAALADLRELARSSCTVSAFLRYARAPFWTTEHGSLVVGDLRFDRSRALDFTDLRVPRPDVDCPRRVPPWTPPRTDLLE